MQQCCEVGNLTQDDRLADVASAISNHLGDVFGSDLTFVASLVLYAENRPALTFGFSMDSSLFEAILRQVRELAQSLDLISLEGKTFIPKTRTLQVIQQTMRPAPLPPNPIENAASALRELEAWIVEVRRHPEFKIQARKRKNWRAASVAGTCRMVWAVAKLNLRDEENRLSFSGLSIEAVDSIAPSSEKHDAPGPFGRFLEDVNAALGIMAEDGRPFAAASALRSLKQARQQKDQN